MYSESLHGGVEWISTKDDSELFGMKPQVKLNASFH